MIFILALISAGFFGVQEASAEQNILINEIMYDLIGSDDKHEWLEIYNQSAEAIDLTGWKLNDGDNATSHTLNPPPKNGSRGSIIIPAGGFILLADDTETLIKDMPNYSGTIIDTTISLNNTSAQLKLLNTEGVEIANISYNKNLGANGNGKTLEWDGGIFKESLSEGGTAGALNSILSSMPPTPPPAENDAATSTPTTTADSTATSTELTNTPNPLDQGEIKINFGDVVINELVSDPADNEVEWIELYNKTGREIDLSGWSLEDGSGAKTKLNGILSSAVENRYKIIEKPAGSLNNGGDAIILYDLNQKIINQLAYGDWPDGYKENNAPSAGDPGSLARKFDGYNTNNDLNDFTATLRPTKGAANIIQAEDEISAETKAKFDFSSDIFISEILPNPAGDDARLEFIEIYNAGKRAINLAGWRLSNENNKKVNLEKIAAAAIIQAGEYLAFFRPSAKIILHNDQGRVKLFQPLAEKPLATVDYKNVKEGYSYNANFTDLKNDNDNTEWIWSQTPTPGAANTIKTVNHRPEIDFSLPEIILAGKPIIFDSSDTADQDGDGLKYAWDFGDGLKNNLANPEHVYLKSGIYKVRLEVSDGQETAEKQKNIKVVDNIGETADASEFTAEKTSSQPSPWQGGGVIINEIFPNPKGADTGAEWLELKNQSSDKISLINWRVENSNGRYKFKSEEIISGGVFYVLNNSKSQLAFKNGSDVISLYNNFDKLADQVKYADAIQGESYARGANGNWFWTTIATPDAANTIRVADSQASVKYRPVITRAQTENYLETNLEKIRELEIGSLIKVKGTVAVEPGILGAQFFYIVGSPGLQIYNYKKNFPALKIGDYIEAVGELTEAQGELRIKTKDKADIKIADHKAPPVALAISSDQVSEEMAGRLVTVTGEITDKKSSTVYLDDGQDEILVYIKQTTGISTKNLTVGQNLAVTGILSKTKTGSRLMPRYQSDMVKINQADPPELEPRVLGEIAAAQEWEVAARNKKMELLKYLLIIAGGVIIILAGLFIKAIKK